MRPMIRFISLAVIVASCSTAAVAQTPPRAPAAPPKPTEPFAPTIEGAFTFGGLAADDSGYLGRLAEYDGLKDRGAPRLALQAWGKEGKLRFDVSGSYAGSRGDQSYRGAIDVDRWLKAHVRYVRIAHRLDHDPLGYIDAASGIGGTFVATHEDRDPGGIYGLDRGTLDARLEVRPPAFSALKLFVSHRRDTRDGVRQTLTVSHCATCHVVADRRATEELTRELTAGAKLLLERLSLDYQFSARRFSEGESSPLNVYGKAVHPATLADVFLNRVQYDARSGALPFDTGADLEKNSHLVRARLGLPAGGSLTGSFSRAAARNRETGMGVDYTGGSGRFVVPIGRTLTLRGTLRRYDIDADSVLVDVAALVSPAGPTANKTYEQAYPTVGELDFITQSAAARTPTEAGLELAYRPFKKTTFRAGYAYEQIDRKEFEVDKTTTNSVLFAGRGQPARQFSWRFRVDYDWTRNPFAYERAAIPVVLQPFPSPGSLPFTGLQYYDMYRSRQADLTAFPTRSGFADQSISWTPSPRIAVTAHYRWRGAKNDELNFSTWKRSVHAPGAEIWIAPGDRWSVMAGYGYQRERLETMFSTLAFVG